MTTRAAVISSDGVTLRVVCRSEGTTLDTTAALHAPAVM